MIKLLVIGAWLLAPLPGLLMGALFIMSARATQLIGTLPQASRHDPAQIGLHDATYHLWYDIVSGLLKFCIYSVVLWLPWSIVTVAVCIRQWHEGRSRRWAIAGGWAIIVYILGFLVLWLEPTNRLGWYFD